MNISSIKRAFPEASPPQIDSYYGEIERWKAVFENRPEWRKVKKGGLYKQEEKRDMNMLNVSKVLCDCFSDLTFSEQADIVISNKKYQEYVEKQLNDNGFWRNFPLWISTAYALGGGCIKVFAEDGNPRIDYVHADKFIPLAWSGRGIFDGAFACETAKNGSNYTLIERQSPGWAEYKLFKSSSVGELGAEIPLSELYENLSPMTDYGDIDIPMFSYFKPSVSNNYIYDVPLGMSVYANALDTLKALDVAFDSFSREFILGKKRIIVPASCIQTVADIETGNMEKYFDADDEAFVALNNADAENLKVTDNTVELRVTEHVAAINALLNILCFQVGLSAGTLSFDAVQGVKTATEIVSQDNKTQRTIKSNKNILAETIERLVHCIIRLGIWLDKLPEREYTVTIGWQDNVIIDDNTLIDNTIKLYSAGLMDLETAIAKVNKCDEQTAAKIAEKIQAGASMGSADFFGGK